MAQKLKGQSLLSPDRKPMLQVFMERENRLTLKTGIVALIYLGIGYVAYSGERSFFLLDLLGLSSRIYPLCIGLLFLWHTLLAIDVGYCWRFRATDKVQMKVMVPGSFIVILTTELWWRTGPAQMPFRSVMWHIEAFAFMAASTYPGFFLGKMLYNSCMAHHQND